MITMLGMQRRNDEIVAALVGRAVAADEAGAVQREHHRQVLQRDVVDQLIVGALQEGRIDRDHRLEALAGEAGGEGDRMLLGDRDVEIAVGKALGEFDQTRALAHRRRDADDQRIALGHVAQPLAEDLRIGGPAWLVSLKILPLAGSNGPGPCHLIGSASAGA